MEGAIIFASLIVGVAIADLLTSLHRLLVAPQKVRWDPLPLLFAAFISLTIIMVWWNIAGSNEETMTIGEFLPGLVTFVFLFLLAHASLPDADHAHRLDLRLFWNERSRYCWILLALAIGYDLTRAIVTLASDGVPVDEIFRRRIFDLTFWGLLVLVAVVRRRWLDWIVLILLAITTLSWMDRSIG